MARATRKRTGSQSIDSMRALIKSSLLLSLAGTLSSAGSDLRVQFVPRFNNAPLAFDSLTNTTVAGQKISVTRLDFLISDFALRNTNGIWLERTNFFAYVSVREGRLDFSLKEIFAGQFDRIRFHIGLRPEINHSDAAQRPAAHPLNPGVNGLHWGWMGGYVFLAIEGNWLAEADKISGYSCHLATDEQLMTVDLPVALDLASDREIQLVLNVDRIFSAPNKIEFDNENDSTHSRKNDALAKQLRGNIERAFTVGATRNIAS